MRHGSAAPGPDDSCHERRLVVEQHAAHAVRLRRLATDADVRVRSARRAWDEAARAVDEARRDADVRLVSAAKEAAREAYRRARAQAQTAAARAEATATWLHEIDRLNRVRAHAGAVLDAAPIRLGRLQHAVARLESEVDAARISAESLEDAWRTARLELARCEERSGAPVVLADDATGRPLILRLLDGERAILPHVGAALAWEAGIDGGHTQLMLTELIEAINARALEEHVLEFPAEHAFWSEFPPDECRALVRALRALGYATDGAGSWAYGRIPLQRDLAMAISHIGLDPRRLRRLPTGAEIDELFRDVRLRSDEYLIAHAPDLSLSGMLGAVGAHAGDLAGLWDAWGRVRPVLLTTQDPFSLD
jgi:hypothetical protein